MSFLSVCRLQEMKMGRLESVESARRPATFESARPQWGQRTLLIRSIESQMRPIYQSDFLRQLIAGLPRICDPGAYTMHLTKEVMTELRKLIFFKK